MIDTVRKLIAVLEPRERRRLAVLIGVMVLVGMLEAAGVASVLPFLAVLSRPEIIHEDPRLAFVYGVLGFTAEQPFLFFLGGFSLAFLITSMCIRAVATFAMYRFMRLREYTISTRLLRGYLARPYAWFIGKHSSDISKTLLAEVEKAIVALTGLVRAVSQATVFVAIVFVVFVVHPLAALAAALMIGGIYGFIVLALRTYLRRLGEERLTANRQRFKVVQDTLQAVKDIKVMGLEAAFQRAYHDPALRYARRQAAFNIVAEVPRFLLEGVAFGSMIAFLLVMLAVSGSSIVELLPVLGVLALAAVRLLPAAQQIFAGVSGLRFFQPSIEALHRDYIEMPRLDPYAQPPAPLPLREEIVLDSVSFTFPESPRPALDKLSLKIRVKTTVAFVGSTGAGKTTAVDVVLGLLLPQQGAILIDGIPLGEGLTSAWQRNVGYVPQHIFLADATIAQNIAFGVAPENIDMEAVERAAKIAELHDFILSRPGAYQARVGERGVMLSGGQRQRIGIARALYADPQVLVLDEATSALDNVTERAVMQAVHKIGGKTIIMIAHRLSTVRGCDEIFILDRGRLVAQGDFDTLLTNDARFRALADSVEAA